MTKKICFILFFIGFTTWSCKEIYTPELNAAPKVLVVEGLITDEAVSHTIHLSTAIPFDSSGYLPESGATVYVTDNNNNQYFFTENTPGYYKSDPSVFKPQIGNKYRMTIETKSKKVYQSSEQSLLPKGTMTDVSNYSKTTPFPITINGNLRYLNVKGTEFVASIRLPSESDQYFRFSNSSFVEYVGYGEDTYYYWKKYNLNEFFNLNDREYNHSDQFTQDIGFCPIDTGFYGIEMEVLHPTPNSTLIMRKLPYKYMVSFKQFHLNEDIYSYYTSLNKQMEAKQRILDPIPFRISGNISCVTNPDEIVFGLFEASSVIVVSYNLDPYVRSNSYNTTKIDPIDLDSISDYGFTKNQPPQFWIY